MPPPRLALPLLVAVLLIVSGPSAASTSLVFTGDWETGNASQWTWGVQCANYGLASGSGVTRGNLYVVNSPVSQGLYGARFDLPASSDRNSCEVLRKRTLNLNSDEYFGLDIRFPSDWQEPSSHSWGMTIGQFNYQMIWGPPLGLFAHRDHVKLVMQSGYCRDVYSGNPGCTYSSGVGGNVPITYAIPSSRFAAGTWHQLLIHVRWSTTSNGILEAWHRRRGESTWVKTVSQTGYPTVQWKDGYTPSATDTTSDKLGAYRGPATFATSIWQDAFISGTSFDAVAEQLASEPSAHTAEAPNQAPAPAVAPPPPPAPTPAPVPAPGTAPAPAPAAEPMHAPTGHSSGSSETVSTGSIGKPGASGSPDEVTSRAAARMVSWRFAKVFLGRAVKARGSADAARGARTVTIYHRRAAREWRLFAVEQLRADGSFRVDKQPWSRRRILYFRAVVSIEGSASIRSRILTLRRTGRGPSAFDQRRQST